MNIPFIWVLGWLVIPLLIVIAAAVYKRITKNPPITEEGIIVLLVIGTMLWPIALAVAVIAGSIIGLYRLIGGPFYTEN